MYSHILVPLDGSHSAEQILPYVEELAFKFASKVTLVRTTISPAELMAEQATSVTQQSSIPYINTGYDPMPIVEAETHYAVVYLQSIAKRLQSKGISVDYRHQEGHAAPVVVDLARSTGADLIAMTTHGRGELGKIVFGSVADAVVHDAPCPILMVKIHPEPER